MRFAVFTIFPRPPFTTGPGRRSGNKYGGMDTEELRKLKALQAENGRLKKLLADKSLDFDILNDAYELLKIGTPNRLKSYHLTNAPDGSYRR